MIKFKEVRWSNAFSYGAKNSVRLDSAPLTQLVGKNGNGKSSVALIIEEVLYNTNSKKVKKSDILNRYVTAKSYLIELDFDKDDVEYEIKTTRTSTASTVKLFKAGVDISSHTATATYSTIAEIIGYDHKTFSQIVYQSSVSALEFLTATDTARKKFLIELLSLTKYTKGSEVFKELASGVNKQVDISQAKISTVNSWLSKYKLQDLTLKELEAELEAPVAQEVKVKQLKTELAGLSLTNKKITQNNSYKAIQNKIVLPDTPPLASIVDLVDKQAKLIALRIRHLEGKSLLGTTPITICKSCNQAIDTSTRFALFEKFESAKPQLELEISSLVEEIASAQNANIKFKEYTLLLADWEKYYALIDTELTSEVLSASKIEKEISVLESEISSINASISKVRASNKLVDAHNTKIAVVSAQLKDMTGELGTHNLELVNLVKESTTLQILTKAFSTTGIVAYKIECLVKDLEALTNEYLGVMADGRFQLSFKIASADKLNVIITDNGRDIDIAALSMGERARVNISTLLAIRKLMQALSNSRTNLLILDETISNLDTEGKERLIEVLLDEESLNTFLIAHDYEHPLLEKISIIKEHNISRIEI